MNTIPISARQVNGGLPKIWYLGDCLIEKSLGCGGMGEVFRASQGDSVVAVKIMHDDMVGETRFHARFSREAAILQSLDHPGIVRFIDFEGGDMPHLVLGYVEGETLKHLSGRLEIDETVGIFIKLCDALSAMHARGIVHRDIKPANIIIADDLSPTLLDFGLAKIADEDVASQSFALSRAHLSPDTNRFLGTPVYSPPESLNQTNKVGPSWDIYSLGITLYEALCRRVPFEAPRIEDLLLLRMIGHPPAPSDYRPMPRRLEKLILHAIEKKPADRFQSAEEMKSALQQCLGRETLLERVMGRFGF